MSEADITPYAYLRHRIGATGSRRRALDWLPAEWIAEDQTERLAAYRVLASYLELASRLNRDDVSANRRDNTREYGDAPAIVDRIYSGIIGERPAIVVAGAEDEPDAQPELPERPDTSNLESLLASDLPDGASAILNEVAEAVQERWVTDVEQSVADWQRRVENYPDALARQRWLRDWAEHDLFWWKIHVLERDGAIGLGDGVAVVLPTSGAFPTLTVYDPDSYFPVLDTRETDDDFPSRVHFAWEEDIKDDNGKAETWVRRITFDLRIFDDAGDDANAFEDTPGVYRDSDGDLVRQHPWRNELSTETCYMTDARWLKTDLQGVNGKPGGVDDFSPTSAKYRMVDWGEGEVALNNLDLGIDFLPVWHLPNTPVTGSQHFGTSSLHHGIQLLDDIIDVDTDTVVAGSLAGVPMLVIAGGEGLPRNADGQIEVEVEAGTVISGTDGVDVVDMSENVDVLMRLNETQLRRLGVNTHVPDEVLGRISADEVPSGIALRLSFSPFEQMLDSLRSVRTPKYQLLFRMVQRVAVAMGVLEESEMGDVSETPTASLAFGPSTPTDIEARVRQVTELVNASAISRRTGLLWLQESGIPIESIPDELDDIAAEDFEGASQMADALVDRLEAPARYLGVEQPADAGGPPPAVSLPPLLGEETNAPTPPLPPPSGGPAAAENGQ